MILERNDDLSGIRRRGRTKQLVECADLHGACQRRERLDIGVLDVGDRLHDRDTR